VWVRLFDSQAQVIPAAAAQLFGLPYVRDALSNFKLVLGASPVGATVVRVRGVIQCPTANIAPNLSAMRFTLHVGDPRDVTSPVQADNAFADAAAYDDYMMFEPFADYQSTAGPAGNVLASSDVGSRLIDVKANRKLQELDQTLVFKASGNSSVAITQTWGCDLSLLLMLP
jgi:hypothetical protein